MATDGGRWLRRGARGSIVALLVAPSACSPDVVIGSDAPDSGSGVTVSDAASVADSGLASVPFPWSTGFENGYGDYDAGGGYCYVLFGGQYSVVTAPAPVHSGTHSMAFSVATDGGGAQSQARCVLQGVLPTTAYYGAWYFIPTTSTNISLWNLIHFLGAADPLAPQHGLWDVSLVNDSTGALRLSPYEFLSMQTPDAGLVPPIPIGAWFHLEVYLVRASDTTGHFTLYQDGQVAVDLPNIKTDDTSWGQFYVGNLATALLPPTETLYVDDVSIGPSL